MIRRSQQLADLITITSRLTVQIDADVSQQQTTHATRQQQTAHEKRQQTAHATDAQQTTNTNLLNAENRRSSVTNKSLSELGITIKNENLSVDQKDKLRLLLEKNSDLFAQSLADLGWEGGGGGGGGGGAWGWGRGGGGGGCGGGGGWWGVGGVVVGGGGGGGVGGGGGGGGRGG